MTDPGETPPKKCKYCGREMARKFQGKHMESRKAFEKRVHCNKECMGLGSRRWK
jgi:hypothetical protein